MTESLDLVPTSRKLLAALDLDTVSPGTSDLVTSFEQLDLSDQMRTALRRAMYEQPTPVQAGFIPVALEEGDAVAQARTGTGKTAAFVIPILELLEVSKTNRDPQALILVPTRELAVQVSGEVEKLSYGLNVRFATLYGGMPIRKQIQRLQGGADIVVGTPGRVIDHLRRGTLRLNNLDCVVLDEADRMLDIGFRPDIERVLKRCPATRQTLLLSATVPPAIQRLAERYMRDPTFLDFSSNVAVETIEQFYFTVSQDRKLELLISLLKHEQPRQAIIFCRTRRGAKRLFEQLGKRFKNVGCMHGDMTQQERNRVMADFRSERLQFMVATDVMGRGIDVTSISHIINFDIPSDCDDYVHRVGRTGRMGREGIAFTFATTDEGEELTKIEMRIDRLLLPGELPGFEVVEMRSTQPEPPKKEVPALLQRGRAKKRYRRW
jgi:ATP-dependent RNA helicase DeaD